MKQTRDVIMWVGNFHNFPRNINDRDKNCTDCNKIFFFLKKKNEEFENQRV